VKCFTDPERVDRSLEYVIGVDGASGIGKDFSVATVMSRLPDGRVQVHAVARSNVMDREVFTDLVSAMGRWWCGERQSAAVVVVETTTNNEDPILARLRGSLSYPDLYVHKDPKARKSQGKFGWQQSAPNKRLALELVRELFPVPVEGEEPEPRVLGLYDDFCDELSSLVYHLDKVSGKYIKPVFESSHDDCVLSFAVGLAGMKNYEERGMLSAVRDDDRPVDKPAVAVPEWEGMSSEEWQEYAWGLKLEEFNRQLEESVASAVETRTVRRKGWRRSRRR
jgi:hypothetical protein